MQVSAVSSNHSFTRFVPECFTSQMQFHIVWATRQTYRKRIHVKLYSQTQMFENIGFQISQHVKTVVKSKRLFAIHFMKIQHFLSNLALKIIICEHAESMFLRGKVSNVKKKVLHFTHRIYSFIFYTYICIGIYMLKWNFQIKMLNNSKYKCKYIYMHDYKN